MHGWLRGCAPETSQHYYLLVCVLKLSRDVLHTGHMLLSGAPAAWGQLAEPEVASQRTEHLAQAPVVAQASAAHLLTCPVAWCLMCVAGRYMWIRKGQNGGGGMQ